jgi:hypothetical protein
MSKHTKDLLADALQAVDLRTMADKAREGFYHDYLSPLDTPTAQLVNDLWTAANNHPENRARILSLQLRVIDGAFDASREEGEAWANSPEGRAAFKRLTRR